MVTIVIPLPSFKFILRDSRLAGWKEVTSFGLQRMKLLNPGYICHGSRFWLYFCPVVFLFCHWNAHSYPLARIWPQIAFGGECWLLENVSDLCGK